MPSHVFVCINIQTEIILKLFFIEFTLSKLLFLFQTFLLKIKFPETYYENYVCIVNTGNQDLKLKFI